MFLLCVSSHLLWTLIPISSGVCWRINRGHARGKSHKGRFFSLFSLHIPSEVLAFTFIARRARLSLFLVDRFYRDLFTYAITASHC